MSKVPVYNQTGEKIEELDLTSAIFDIEPKVELLEEAVRMQLANARQPLGHTKTRAEVRGGGRKPWKQKGTGRARHGSIRSPLWSGGGVTFGPRSNRNWQIKMNKSAYRKALFMALTDKVRNNALIVVDKMDIDQPKTAILAKILKNFLEKVDAAPRNVLLVVLPGKDGNLEVAGKNLAGAQVTRANSLSVYDILRSNNLVVLKDAISTIEKTYSRKE